MGGFSVGRKRLARLDQIVPHQRSQWLDGLRGTAALIVIFGHCGNFEINVIPLIDLTATAKAGVWIFFILSAYLLTGKMLFQLDSGLSNRTVLLGYAVRRVFRIMPLYLALLSVLWVLHLLGWHYVSVFDLHTVVRHALLLEGWQHLWTIPVEMTFYAVLPLIVLLLSFCRKDTRPAVVTLVLLVSIVIYIAAPHTIGPSFRIANNPLGLQSYMLFFVAGILVAVIGRRTDWGLPLAIGGVALFILLHPVLLEKYFSISLYQALDLYPLSAAGAALVLFAGTQSRFVQKAFAHRWLVFVGKVSFGLYLTHYFVLHIIAQAKYISLLSPALGAIAVCVSLLVAAACYRLVEAPVKKLGGQLAGHP